MTHSNELLNVKQFAQLLKKKEENRQMLFRVPNIKFKKALGQFRQCGCQ